MNRLGKGFCIICIWSTLLVASSVNASDLRIGASLSVIRPIQKLCQQFEKLSSYHCKITTTSTGHLYAQSMHSNLFDIFIGSNLYYANGLIQAGKANPKLHYLLATSRIVLWSSDPDATNENLYYRLTHDNHVSIVVPDPKIANYGMATKQTLQNLDIWAGAQKRLVLASSVRQAHRILRDDPSQIGFVSLAQLNQQERKSQKYWEPDDALHEPVSHDLLVMSASANKKAQLAFIHMLEDVDVCLVFESEGYQCELKKI